MSFILNLALGLLASFVASFLAPRPKGPKPADLSDFDIPRSEEGIEIGLAYGSPWIKAAQNHWFGDFSSSGIKQSGGKK